jgi:divalent metal cation (Fe/Co/Zn/Cd) transporter
VSDLAGGALLGARGGAGDLRERLRRRRLPIEKLISPDAPDHLLALRIAGCVGFAGNEIAAQIRLGAGRRLNSPALIADGYHARTDGFVSLGVLLTAVLVALGLPLADPVIAIVITGVILHITWQSWLTVSEGAQLH